MTAISTLTRDPAPEASGHGSHTGVPAAGRALPAYDATDPRRIALRGVEPPRSFGFGSFPA